jgi:hypothetical protein
MAVRIPAWKKHINAMVETSASRDVAAIAISSIILGRDAYKGKDTTSPQRIMNIMLTNWDLHGEFLPIHSPYC